MLKDPRSRRPGSFAADGAYEEGAFADTPAALRARYFSRDVPARVVPELRALVAFERRDLLRDDPPPGGLHLIACRNVGTSLELAG